jgi:tetratricopeptide (TPR) repeat protein
MLPRLGDPPHALLGVPETASPAMMRQAFLRLTKLYHPTKFARFSPDIVRLANEVFLTIKRAYDQLTAAPKPALAAGTSTQPVVRPTPARSATGTPSRAPTPPTGIPARATTPPIVPTSAPAPNRPSTPPPRAASPRVPTPAIGIPRAALTTPPTPEAELEAALELARRRLWADARQAFQKLAVASPQDKKFRAYMHWARGREAQEAGRNDEARAELQRALALAPDLTQAKVALDSLPQPPSDPGVLSRLFKR